MDPLACFYAWLGAAQDGDLDLAADAAENFSGWRAKGGLAPTLPDGSTVVRIDNEQDRFLVMDGGVERWRKAHSYAREAP